jgi:methylmalonyl-CoA mutase C-terminal domain/subunit
MEVVYTGLHQTPEMIVRAAVQEDVDVIGLSVHSGAHVALFTKVLELMKQQGLENVLLTGGGIIPDEDRKALEKKGVGRLFGPGTHTKDLADYIRDEVARRRGRR